MGSKGQASRFPSWMARQWRVAVRERRAGEGHSLRRAGPCDAAAGATSRISTCSLEQVPGSGPRNEDLGSWCLSLRGRAPSSGEVKRKGREEACEPTPALTWSVCLHTELATVHLLPWGPQRRHRPGPSVASRPSWALSSASCAKARG